ncbi:MAG: hypothetical protein KAT34_17255 [Candidatus Aminicenantes bacterium]|nr:hypothetical protein [Candidatus Aminicenantes bacterium]
MKNKKQKFLLSVFIVLLCSSWVVGYSGEVAKNIVTPESDPLLGRYEQGNREFERYEIGRMIVYFHQRSLKGAVVEKDFTVYQFDMQTEELLLLRVNRRENIPAFSGPVVSKEEAESMVGGDVILSRLLIISPESDIFPLDPVPENPCWVVRHVKDSEIGLAVIDSLTGDYLGAGIAPPVNAYAFTGPTDSAPPCSGSWSYWTINADTWFEKWGYPSENAIWPATSVIKSKVRNTSVGLIYEFGHGGSNFFLSACQQYTTAQDIGDWMASGPKKTFVFLGHCGGMCQTGENTLSYEYRKGSLIDTVTVGYCNMADAACANCWSNSLDWQDSMFNYIYRNYTVKEAFDQATADYPMCSGCVRYIGDDSLTLNISPPVITLSVRRKIEYSWTARRYYAEIDLTFKNEDSLRFPKYELYRKEAGGTYVEIKEIASTDAISVSHTVLDDLPAKDKSYTYRVGILNAQGTVVKYSDEVTIHP